MQDTIETLDKIGLLIMQLENRIDDLAMYACKRGAPRSVQMLCREMDTLRNMDRRINKIVLGVDT